MFETAVGSDTLILNVIAHIHTDFHDKFGIPRQSGLADTKGKIVFEPEYRNSDMIRGIVEYSLLWIMWGFSDNFGKEWHPTVRPPRLGGNKRIGVFATRSPFRPNPIGLSCVKLEKVEKTEDKGYILCVTGADLKNGTPIYDIKPYLPYVDAHPEAEGGFAQKKKDYELAVEFPVHLLENVPEDHRKTLKQVLAQDPRPSYQNDPERIYRMGYAGLEVRFQVSKGKLKVCDVFKIENAGG